MNLQQAIDYAKPRLRTEEGRRPKPYNDKTGKTLTLRPAANITIGDGINLENGLYPNEMDFIFNNRTTIAANEVAPYWWFKNLDEVRASVFIDLCYNDGLPHLLHFVLTLSAAGNGDWQEAHDQLLDSDAAREDVHRYQVLAEILLTGVNQ